MSLSVRTKFPNNQSMRGILPPDHVGTLFESPEKAIETKVASFLLFKGTPVNSFIQLTIHVPGFLKVRNGVRHRKVWK